MTIINEEISKHTPKLAEKKGIHMFTLNVSTFFDNPRFKYGKNNPLNDNSFVIQTKCD